MYFTLLLKLIALLRHPSDPNHEAAFDRFFKSVQDAYKDLPKPLFLRGAIPIMIQTQKLKQKHSTKYKNLPTCTDIRTFKNKCMPKIFLLIILYYQIV